MKILLTVDPEIPVPPLLYGGIERIVDVLVNGYVQSGHNVTLCANPASKVPCELVPWKGSKSQHPPDSIKNLSTVTRLVYGRRYDIIHSFSRLAYLTAIMPLKIPKIMSYQREPTLSQVKKATTLSRKGSMVFTGCSDYISNQVKQVAEAYTIYNCVPIDKYQFTERVEDDAPLVFLGRIEDIKGTHIAAEAARNLNRRLLIAGNIPAGKEDYFNQQVKPLLNERIQYVGPVDDQHKNRLLGSAAALLMPIQWNEPFGIVMVEAMACGTPVIGFPRGAVPEVVQDGSNGFIAKDPTEMEQKIALLPTIGRRTVRKIAEEKFSDKTIVKQYLDLYTTLLTRRKS